MIKKFNTFNEGLLNNLEGPSEEQIWKTLNNLKPKEMLFKSAEIGFLPGIIKAIKRGADVHSTISKENYYSEYYDENILDIIAKKGYFDIFDNVYKYFITDDKKNNIRYINELLINVCESGNINLVKKLLEMGAKIYTSHNSPLLGAVENGHLELVKYLLDNGAYIHAHHNAALKNAIENNHTDVVKYLLEKGADIDDTRISQSYFNTVFKNNNLELIKLLYNYGFNFNDYEDCFLNKYLLLDLIRDKRMDILNFIIDNGFTLKKQPLEMKDIDNNKISVDIVELLKKYNLLKI